MSCKCAYNAQTAEVLVFRTVETVLPEKLGVLRKPVGR
jgi:hypothetical protein